MSHHCKPICIKSIRGHQGHQGIAGQTGPQGIAGSSINTGPTGSQGTQGPQGPQGQQGVNSLSELTDVQFGTSCNSNIVGLQSGDIVQYDGSKWTNRSGQWINIQMTYSATTEVGTAIPRYARLTQSIIPGLGILIYYFDVNLEESLYLSQILPFNYKSGTNIYIRIHTTPQTDTFGVVRWGLEYSWRNIGQSFDSTNFIYNETTIVSNDRNVHYQSTFDSIDGTNMQPSSVFTARFFRDALHPNDTFTSSVGLHGIELVYQSCGLGANSI